MRWLAFLLVGAQVALAAADGIQFEGSQTFQPRRLLRALQRYDIRLAVPVEPTAADDAAFFLQEFLNEQGFPDAEVHYRVQPGGGVTFQISEGAQFQLGRLTVTGAKQITEQRVSDIFTAAVRQATLRPFGRLRFVEVAIDQAVARITAAYVHEGFLDAEVESATAIEGRMVNVGLQIVEGPRFRVSDVQLLGDVPEKVRKITKDFINHNYRPGQELVFRTKVLDTLRNAGYFDAQVSEATANRSGENDIVITLSVSPGVPYRLGQITVQGNKRTLTSAILKRLGAKPGTSYDAAKLDTGVRRLWFSGAFSDINVKRTPTADHDVDVDLAVEEGSAKQFTLTGGYGEWYGVMGEGLYTDRNFFGTLNRFSLKVFGSQKNFGGEAVYSIPWLFNVDATGNLGAFAVRAELPAFRSTQIGANLGLERKFSERTTSGWLLNYQWKSVMDSEIFAENALDGAPINYTLGMLSYRYTIDRRNDILSPMKGWYLRGDAGVASRVLGGDVSFARLTGQATWYLPLAEITPERPFVPFFVFNERAGLLLPYADTESVPVQERFFLGGPNTVRSFQLDGMAPRDSQGDPEGGLAYFVSNTELQWPVWKGLYLAGFIDIGNLAPTVEEFTWGDTRIGVGLGGRFYTPLGAIRVDYGHNLIRKDGDPIGAWQFGFGFTF